MFEAEHIPYSLTNSFSKIVLDYLQGATQLLPFYAYPPDLNGIKDCLQQKHNQPIDRKILNEVLTEQYHTLECTETVKNNIESLLSEKTFTVCTAHQPNLFTGPLYFIYKIAHAIKLAKHLTVQLPEYHFVPVYYMGSEDADFDELSHFAVEGKKYSWNTAQHGSFGRMIVDKKIMELTDQLHHQISVFPHGDELISIIKKYFAEGQTIQVATQLLVNELFGEHGLLVLNADDARLKSKMLHVFEEDLFQQTPSALVEKNSEQLSAQYNVQAYPREINLFYLENNIRERIIKQESGFRIHNTELIFSENEMRQLLKDHPEKFSPNVILRGLYQETILPNIAFVGGGGELAYWLQLKELFEKYKIIFPVLILRNSFVILAKKHIDLIQKLKIETSQLFDNEMEILNTLLEKEGKLPHLNGVISQVESLYAQLQQTAYTVDTTLAPHVSALQTRAVTQLQNLEKKMKRAERKKNEATARQINKIKQELFPNNVLQERVENFSSYYAKWGKQFIDEIVKQSLALDQKFTVLKTKN